MHARLWLVCKPVYLYIDLFMCVFSGKSFHRAIARCKIPSLVKELTFINLLVKKAGTLHLFCVRFEETRKSLKVVLVWLRS